MKKQKFLGIIFVALVIATFCVSPRDAFSENCFNLTRKQCRNSTECTLDCVRSTRTSYNNYKSPCRGETSYDESYFCRPSLSPCEVGLVQTLNTKKGKKQCQERQSQGCIYYDSTCYCPCGKGEEMCDCDCGGHIPPTCTFKNQLTPGQVGALPLVSNNPLLEKHKNSIKKVIEKLSKEKIDPSLFFVSINPGTTTTKELTLWHRNHFDVKNINARGNPSGKNRIMIYDIKSKKIIRDAYTR